jgi:hypothetical protein
MLGSPGCADESLPDEVIAPENTRTQLRWRRFRAQLADLGRALELDADDLCRDADGAPCAVVGPVTVTDYLQAHQGVSPDDVLAECATRQGTTKCSDEPYIDEFTPKGVHVFALGGNEPFLGRFTPLAQPGLTTPLVVDRVALLACGERVRRDAEGTPLVFTSLDLSLPVVNSRTPGFRETVAELFRRLLAREATSEELNTVLALAEGERPLSARQAARLACFVIATTTEVMFQ